jgi:hypothetical protein
MSAASAPGPLGTGCLSRCLSLAIPARSMRGIFDAVETFDAFGKPAAETGAIGAARASGLRTLPSVAILVGYGRGDLGSAARRPAPG